MYPGVHTDFRDSEVVPIPCHQGSPTMIQLLYSTGKEIGGKWALPEVRMSQGRIGLRLLASTGSLMGTWLLSRSQYVGLI